MLLLAGDLFHENRPSRTSLYQTISALRERCLSDRPISLELVSDAGLGIMRDAKCVCRSVRVKERELTRRKRITAGQGSITRMRTSTSACPSFQSTEITMTHKALVRCARGPPPPRPGDES
jgi:hypothetical protein